MSLNNSAKTELANNKNNSNEDDGSSSSSGSEDGGNNSSSGSSSSSSSSDSDSESDNEQNQEHTQANVEKGNDMKKSSKSTPESTLWYENIPIYIHKSNANYSHNDNTNTSGKHTIIEEDSSDSDSDSDSDSEEEDNSNTKESSSSSSFKITMSYTQALAEKDRATTLLSEYAVKNKPKTSISDTKWLESMLRNGTLSDKIASMALLIQQSPMTTLSKLDQLLHMAQKQQSREALLSVEAARDLFLTNLLPDRKLKRFHENNLDPKQITDLHRIYFCFEDGIKERFATFVDVLENGLTDTLPYFKRSCLNGVYALLNGKPELEQRLLRILINKLGDPDRQVASKVVYLTQQLLSNHPMMKGPVVTGVEELLYRPNLTKKSQYYAIIFLNQIALERGQDQALALKMIKIYFAIFESSVAAMGGGRGKLKNIKGLKASKKEQESAMKTKLLSALLTGVNRAFPYSKATGKTFDKLTDTLFRIVHTSTFNTSIQALMLLLQVMTAQNALSDRFYRALYQRLQSDDIMTTSKHSMLLNIIYKSMKVDTKIGRVRAIIMRLLQMCFNMGNAFVCAVLYTISEVMKAKPELKNMITTRPTLPASSQKSSSSISKGGNSSSNNNNSNNSKLGRNNNNSTKKNDVEQNNNNKSSSSSSDDSDSSDSSSSSSDSGSDSDSEANKEGEEKQPVETTTSTTTAAPTTTTTTTTTTTITKSTDDVTNSGEEIEMPQYDPSKRDPQYANGEYAMAWSLTLLAKHYHPTVQAFTKQLLTGNHEIVYDGDPLRDVTDLAFLEKFAYRKPKQKHIDSIKQPVISAGAFSNLSSKIGRVSTDAPVNSVDFLQGSSKSGRAEDQFYIQFFKEKEFRRLQEKRRKKRKARGEDSSDEDGAIDTNDQDDSSEEEMNEEDIEAGFDAYSDKLALGLMEENAGGLSDGEDDEEDAMWDFSEDDDEEDEDPNGAGNDKEGDSEEKDMQFDGVEDSDDEDEMDVANIHSKKKRGGKGSKKNPFADSEDFLEILEKSGQDHLNTKERQWVDQSNARGKRGKKRRGKKSHLGGKKKRRK